MQAGSTAHCCLAVLLFLQADITRLVGIHKQLNLHALQAELSGGSCQQELSKIIILL
jgi:hypothetical protein